LAREGEGKARTMLVMDLGVPEKQVYPQIKKLGKDLTSAFSFTDLIGLHNPGSEPFKLTQTLMIMIKLF
jgi:hypothetical protein